MDFKPFRTGSVCAVLAISKPKSTNYSQTGEMPSLASLQEVIDVQHGLTVRYGDNTFAEILERSRLSPMHICRSRTLILSVSNAIGRKLSVAGKVF